MLVRHTHAHTLTLGAHLLDMPLLLALQDLPGALSDAQVAEGLGLTSIKSRDWSIFKTSGAWWLCSWPIVCRVCA